MICSIPIISEEKKKMSWKSMIPNFIMNVLLKQRGSKTFNLLLWKKDVIWGQYDEGQYSTYEIYFPSLMLRIYDHSADTTAPWRQIRFYHLRRSADHKWESKISEATWTRDVHVAAYWENILILGSRKRINFPN